MNTSKYKHIIWDWNGTLFDDSWLCVEIINKMLHKRNLPLMSHKHYQETFNFPIVDYYRNLGFDFTTESFESLGTEFILEYERRRLECKLQRNAIDVLESINNYGITQSLLSAYKQNTLEEIVEHFQLRRFFIKVIGLDNHYANSKIDNGKHWIEKLNFNSYEVLLVGDTIHDYEVVEEIGTDCVLIPSGHHPKEKLKICGVQILDSLTDILHLLH